MVNHPNRSKVVTYQAPGSNDRIALTNPQARRLRAAGRWPKNSRGVEYCDVYQGLTVGSPTYSDEELSALYGV